MFTCWFYKWMISECIDTDRVSPRRLRNHLQRCPACRRFYEYSAQVSEQLAAESAREQRVPSPFLRGKILASLNKSYAPTPHRILRPAWPISVAVFTLFLVFAVFLQYRETTMFQVSPTVSSRQNGSNATGLLMAAAKLPTEEKLLEWSRKFEQPLEAELRSVIHDARTAIDLLAYNFLPESLSPLR